MFGEWQGEADFLPNLFPSVARETILRYQQIPLWNPYSLGGFSLTSTPLTETFHPFFLLRLLLDVYKGVLIEYALYSGFAGLGLYLLSRQLGASREAAILPGIAFVSSNIMPVYLVNGWFNFMGISLLPLGLWAYARVAGLRFPDSARFEALLSFVLAQMLLMADNYHFIFMGWLLLIIALSRVFTRQRRNSLKSLIRVALVTGLIAGVKLVPVLYGREGFESNVQTGYSFTLPSLVHALTAWNTSTDYQWESVGYIGPVIIALSILGFAGAWRKAWPYGVCFLFFMIFSLGSNLTPQRLFAGGLNLAEGPEGFSLVGLMHIFPLLDTLHNPSRGLPVVAVLLMVFAAIGLDAVFNAFERITGRLYARKTRPFICIAVCCLAVVPGLNETSIYLEMKMHELEWPQFDRFSTFRQFREWHGANSLCPVLNFGNLNPGLSYYKLSNSLRAVEDPGYSGEERWLGDGSVELVEWTPNRLVYSVSGEGEGMLVVNQNFASDWRVSEPDSMIVSSHFGLLSVTARAPCEITLTYLPGSFIHGLVATCIGILILVLMLLKPNIRQLDRSSS